LVDIAQFDAQLKPEVSMKTPAQATAKYLTNGSAAVSTGLWATNYNAKIGAIFDAAAASVSRWQAAVQDPAVAARFVKGLGKAKTRSTQIATKVTTVGAPALAAGVRAAAAVDGAYTAFSNAWIPAVSQEVATLNQTNPRGDRAANRARQAAYDSWVDQQNGNFKQ
jgi:hypothetical protein